MYQFKSTKLKYINWPKSLLCNQKLLFYKTFRRHDGNTNNVLSIIICPKGEHAESD